MIDWIGNWLRTLPPWGIGLIAVGAVGLVTGGAVAGYRTYDYVEHDNEFCLSCHLMVEPYELFARSAHRDLGCKACHKPTFAARSQMALSQIIENPDSLTAHAEVPNEKCAACHVQGDPDRWESIRNSAGHRVHLESNDPSLQGLNCVECHSTSLHQFTAASETCAQSGCHEDSDIQLGGMGDLTIHCTACHGFSDPVPEGTPLEAALAATRPNANACLSCHAMRALVDMPPDEPHDAVCGKCHNPHEQATPEQAVESCATAGCHSQPDTLTPMHRGLGIGELADCTQCHVAHDWNVEAETCLGCHEDVVEEGGIVATGPEASDPALPGSVVPGLDAARRAGLVHPAGLDLSGPGPRAASPGEWPLPPTPAVSGTGSSPGSVVDSDRAPPAGRATPVWASSAPQQVRDTATFSHRRHRNVECTQCHSTEQSHGQLTVVGLEDCRSCHHRPPVSNDCSRCHEQGSTPGEVYSMTRDMAFSVGDAGPRDLPFDHGPHVGLECSSCHTEGLERSAAEVDCTACHEQHHRPEASCRSCHEPAPASAHPNEVHQGCSGSGCHQDVAPGIQGVPRTRPFCLACHQDRVEHRPGQNCVECHRLPGGAVGPQETG
ncbi:MAG: hypothetical protein PVI57_04790 [Gemmatimonadota bacterium]